jgi:UDPglucose--hexose-1-phosphate uridylyltransferase
MPRQNRPLSLARACPLDNGGAHWTTVALCSYPFRAPLMSELRRDPLSGHWVIVAEGRSERPQDFKINRQVRSPDQCSFCAGHEEETPGEVFAVRSQRDVADEADWKIRVVPNKYPALHPDSGDIGLPSLSPLAGKAAESLFTVSAGCGVHEVIIETPEHLVRTTDLHPKQLAAVIRVYRSRLQALRANKRIHSGIVFKNVGPEAGATIEHTHSQLIGLPINSPRLAAELNATRVHQDRYGNCLFCDLIAAEKQLDRRIVATTERYLALCPYASRQPYETWILPHAHQANFDTLCDDACDELADLLLGTLQAIDTTLDKPAYNYMVLSAPFDSDPGADYHWRMVIIPRLTIRAGFEWGTLCSINPVPPEEAARDLQFGCERAN